MPINPVAYLMAVGTFIVVCTETWPDNSPKNPALIDALPNLKLLRASPTVSPGICAKARDRPGCMRP